MTAARRRLLAALVAAPDRLVMVLFWTCLVVSLTVLAGVFRPVVVLPALAAVLAATWRLTPRPVAVTRRSALGSGAALVLAAVWVAVNVPFASEFVVVARDPGFLTLEGFWLSEHASPRIPVGRAAELLAAVPGAGVDTEAYARAGDVVHAQGAKLVPGLLGLAGWLGGARALLAANLVVGAVGLLAVYGLARRILPPLWALAPAVGLALSLPMIAFSRSAYTEPVALAVVIGGATMAWSAWETRTWWRHLLAGALVGASALARIDGAGPATGLVVGAGLVAVAVLGSRRERAWQALLATAAGALAMVALGYVDLRVHSPWYLEDHVVQFRVLTGAFLVTTALGLLVALPRWPRAAARFLVRHSRGAAVTAASAVAVAGAVLASRPLWLVTRHAVSDPLLADAISRLQRKAGLPVDPTRTYDETTVSWLAWYLGWATVVAGFAGLAYLTYRAVRRRDPRLVVVLALVAAPTALYLWRVSITPDQIWAMRRLLPVTMPGLLVAATAALYALWRKAGGAGRPLAVVAAAVVALFPLVTWSPMLTVVEHGGRLDEAEAVCAAVGGGPVLYVHAPLTQDYFATLRVLCDVDTARVVGPVDQELLREVGAIWGDAVTVVTLGADAVPWTGGAEPEALRETVTTQWERTIASVPAQGLAGTQRIWVGHVTPDGTVTPLPPAVPDAAADR